MTNGKKCVTILKTSFTDFLEKVQRPNIITAHPTVSDVTYVWEDDDFIQSEHGLLAVLLEEDLRSLYGAHSRRRLRRVYNVRPSGAR